MPRSVRIFDDPTAPFTVHFQVDPAKHPGLAQWYQGLPVRQTSAEIRAVLEAGLRQLGLIDAAGQAIGGQEVAVAPRTPATQVVQPQAAPVLAHAAQGPQPLGVQGQPAAAPVQPVQTQPVQPQAAAAPVAGGYPSADAGQIVQEGGGLAQGVPNMDQGDHSLLLEMGAGS